jgi:thioredoxin-dependent peroxiredoxin
MASKKTGRVEKPASPSKKTQAAKPSKSTRAPKPAKKAPAKAAATKIAAKPVAAKPVAAKPVAPKPVAPKPAKGGARVAVGDKAPSFTLKDDRGQVVTSESLKGKAYVLYFYPKDDTTGCTMQACGFRDSLPRFGAKGVKVLGVSPDNEASHERFRKKYELTFPLLADTEKKLCEAYGVWTLKKNYGREYMGVERSTFVIGADGKVKQAWRGVRVPGHVDAVLGAV